MKGFKISIVGLIVGAVLCIGMLFFFGSLTKERILQASCIGGYLGLAGALLLYPNFYKRPRFLVSVLEIGLIPLLFLLFKLT